MSTHSRQLGKDPTQVEPRGTCRLLAACWPTPISFVELVKKANHNRVWQEYFSIMWSVSVNIFKGTEHTEDEKKSCPWKLGKNQQRPVPGPEGYICPFSWSSTVHWSLLKNGLSGRVAVKTLLLRQGSREKWVGYAKWHKKSKENQCQQVLWSDESTFDPNFDSPFGNHPIGSTDKQTVTAVKMNLDGKTWTSLPEPVHSFQCGIILTGNGTKHSLQEESFGMCLVKPHRVQAVFQNKGGHTNIDFPAVADACERGSV